MASITCTIDPDNPYSCDCAECEFANATESYYEILAETGSSVFYGVGFDAADSMTVARGELGPPPTRADFGLAEIRRAAPRPVAPVDPDDLPF